MKIKDREIGEPVDTDYIYDNGHAETDADSIEIYSALIVDGADDDPYHWSITCELWGKGQAIAFHTFEAVEDETAVANASDPLELIDELPEALRENARATVDVWLASYRD
jgi:hypothetical protein